MPKFVRMRKQFEFPLEGGNRRMLPPGWAGHLPDDVAQTAIDGGYTTERQAAGARRPAARATEEANDSMTREQLEEMAQARNINPSEHRTKADLIAAINAG